MKTAVHNSESHRSQRAGRPPRIGEILLARGLVTKEQIDAALVQQATGQPRRRLGEILAEQGVVSQECVVAALADALRVPYVNITQEMIEPEALRCLPPEFLDQHNALPLSTWGGRLRIAVGDFTDVFLLDEIARITCMTIDLVAANPDSIRSVREATLLDSPVRASLPAEIGDAKLDALLDQVGLDDLKVVEYDAIEEDDGELAAHASDSPVVKIVTYILQAAVEARASDIHIEPEQGCFRVRYRIDGQLIDTIQPSPRLLPAVVSRIKIMAGLDISERRLPQDGSITVTIAERPVDLRVSTMKAAFGEKVVLRLIDRAASIRDLESLGLAPEPLEILRHIVQSPNGLFLVTGPTGSGKTTTLYAVLSELITPSRNISTIEDPVERVLPGTSQFQVHSAAGFTFARALRSLLRQDPDILMVGEIRDVETATLATEAGMTGHLVLSTLHTNDSISAIPRLMNMGVDGYLVAATLRGVLAQRLALRLCKHCQRPAPLSDDERANVERLVGHNPSLEQSFIAPGCNRCSGRGVHGRTGVFELLATTEEELCDFIMSITNSKRAEYRQRLSVTPMAEDALRKIADGTIGLESLRAFASGYHPYAGSK